jgi:hypothetical protein
MVYTPSKQPKQALIVIALIAAAGIAGGYFLSKYIMAIALIYWMQYTAILSYLQFKHKSKHKFRGFTEYMLHPQVRFFVFEFMAFIGLGSLLKYDSNLIGALALGGWFAFSLNFYRYYNQFKEYEE